MKTKFLLTVLFSIGIIGISNAQIAQNYRTHNGVKSGALTRTETVRLHQEQARINHDKRHALKDGRISRHERKQIRREQKRHSRHIARMKHNRRVKHF